MARELSRHEPPRGGVVVCAVSGGKDSITALHLAHRYLAPAGVRVEAISIDEGIAGYRAEGLAVAERACRDLGVPHAVVSFAERFGPTMDQASEGLEGGAPCSPCGVFRRTLLNQAARERGAMALVTGHNLDDLAQSVLMNVLRGDVGKLARLARHDDGKPGLVPRLMPLRMVPEREVALYAHLQGWEVHLGECPYAQLARRRDVRDVLLTLEEREPGTRHALVGLLDKLAPALRAGLGEARLRACPDCGEPTSGERCRACAMAERLVAAERV